MFDVFVNYGKDRKGRDIIARPVLVGIQDVFSRKILAHRIGQSENAGLVRLAFADLFRHHGIPYHAVMDNDRAFASKAMTGGTDHRFRGKVKDTDPTGVLTSLSVRIYFTLPYRGSSKPIERAWRDLCESIAKHPELAGAYTGNRPDAKPDNYRSRAIPIDEFQTFVARQYSPGNSAQSLATPSRISEKLSPGFSFMGALIMFADRSNIQWHRARSSTDHKWVSLGHRAGITKLQ